MAEELSKILDAPDVEEGDSKMDAAALEAEAEEDAKAEMSARARTLAMSGIGIRCVACQTPADDKDFHPVEGIAGVGGAVVIEKPDPSVFGDRAVGSGTAEDATDLGRAAAEGLAHGASAITEGLASAPYRELPAKAPSATGETEGKESGFGAGTGAGAGAGVGAGASKDDVESGDGAGAGAGESSAVALPTAIPRAGAGAMRERCKFIPLRLEYEERHRLHVLEAALHCSQYVDKVDIQSFWTNKAKRIYAQVKEMCAILSGLMVASDYKKGQKLIKDREFKDNKDFFQGMFELGRRYKIMNPEKMRTSYGKLCHLLQDSEIPEIQELLQFSCFTPVETVSSLLNDAGCGAMMDDPMMEVATIEIVDDKEKSRYELETAIRRKNKAIDALARKYANRDAPPDEIKKCLYSVSDNNSYLNSNRGPCDAMIDLLKANFRPDTIETGYSLAINYGKGGARLSHEHDRQYAYVLQSLTLWSEISHHMFKLWFLAEADLFDGRSPYRLRDTGQGLNRLQAAPRVYRAMHEILATVQRRVGSWVGSSVVHLGDHNVPNALVFIDKYTQVARILSPIVTTLNQIPLLARDNPALARFFESEFGGVAKLKKDILLDFFRHAFDGSGALNFFDAGSCIDGRLTSAWNWCSLIEKKPYFPVFLLSGFIGFDGDWQK